MSRFLIILLVAWGGSGCTSLKCEDCTSGPPMPTVTVTDNGTTLSVQGCQLVGFVGCTGMDDTMVVTLDGQTHDIPASTVDLGSYDHQIDLPSPSDPDLDVVLAGDDTGSFIELPDFTITGPTDVTRGGSIVTSIDYEAVTDKADITMATTCDGVALQWAPNIEADPVGHAAIDLSGASGDCSHVVTVSQGDMTEGGVITIHRIRTQTFTFTSEP